MTLSHNRVVPCGQCNLKAYMIPGWYLVHSSQFPTTTKKHQNSKPYYWTFLRALTHYYKKAYLQNVSSCSGHTYAGSGEVQHPRGGTARRGGLDGRRKRSKSEIRLTIIILGLLLLIGSYFFYGRGIAKVVITDLGVQNQKLFKRFSQRENTEVLL